eukprot:TRINITY_DN4081_c0_g2_i16.p2 TRINITY_DN4081_c0_g2~~TRINITY_DN4081_c0_g2_i16.p2  ORF type:complete len:169 (+),score=48.97 TRINITY_DN4081_c0_g2_i16:156-662(+)
MTREIRKSNSKDDSVLRPIQPKTIASRLCEGLKMRESNEKQGLPIKESKAMSSAHSVIQLISPSPNEISLADSRCSVLTGSRASHSIECKRNMSAAEILRKKVRDLEVKNESLSRMCAKEREEKQKLLNNFAQERNRWNCEKIILIKANMKLSKMMEEINSRINCMKK